MDTFYGSASTGKGTTYYYGVAHAIGADATGNIYAAGRLGIPTKSSATWEWVVRKSSNGGNSWSTVDTFQLSSGFNRGLLGLLRIQTVIFLPLAGAAETG